MEEKVKQLEEKINQVIEESVLAGCKGDHRKGLELAKEAANKEKALMKLKEQAGSNEGHDWDITFAVLFNLGTQYEEAEMYTEALTTYTAISKNKLLVHGPKVKINVGNIYFKQGHPTKAIKMYRMAMDQLNNTHKDLRLKLMHNMGIIFLKMEHPADAAASFEYIMQEKASFKTGLHLVVANFMAGDSEKIKRSFQDLLQVPIDYDEDEDKYSAISVSAHSFINL
jgi:intraflagellar transport protein 88